MHSPVVLGLDVGGMTIAVSVRAAATGRRPGSSTAGTRPDGDADRSRRRGVRVARPSPGRVAIGQTPAAAGGSVRPLGIATRRELLHLPGTTPLEKGLSG